MKHEKTSRGLTHENLLKALSYNSETGVFVRLSGGRFGSVGKIAGYLDAKTDLISYVRIAIGYKKYYAHDLAIFYMTGVWPASFPDHIDGNGTNNRISNLRLSTASENCGNSKKPKSNTSGYKGVSLTKSGHSFRAYITKDRKQISLGVFPDAISAAAAYKAASQKMFGEFSCTDR